MRSVRLAVVWFLVCGLFACAPAGLTEVQAEKAARDWAATIAPPQLSIWKDGGNQMYEARGYSLTLEWSPLVGDAKSGYRSEVKLLESYQALPQVGMGGWYQVNKQTDCTLLFERGAEKGWVMSAKYSKGLTTRDEMFASLPKVIAP